MIDPRPEPFELGFETLGWAIGKELGEVIETDGGRACAEERIEVHVVHVVLPGERDITRITTDGDVGDVRVVRETVERGMGLDEPAMGLHAEVGDHVVSFARQHVEPRGDEIQRLVEGRCLEHEQRADHLHPRRTALRRRADDDVVGPEFEAFPTRTIRDQ